MLARLCLCNGHQLTDDFPLGIRVLRHGGVNCRATRTRRNVCCFVRVGRALRCCCSFCSCRCSCLALFTLLGKPLELHFLDLAGANLWATPSSLLPLLQATVNSRCPHIYPGTVGCNDGKEIRCAMAHRIALMPLQPALPRWAWHRLPLTIARRNGGRGIDVAQTLAQSLGLWLLRFNCTLTFPSSSNPRGACQGYTANGAYIINPKGPPFWRLHR
jgi:hypothetical protein